MGCRGEGENRGVVIVNPLKFFLVASNPNSIFTTEMILQNQALGVEICVRAGNNEGEAKPEIVIQDLHYSSIHLHRNVGDDDVTEHTHSKPF